MFPDDRVPSETMKDELTRMLMFGYHGEPNPSTALAALINVTVDSVTSTDSTSPYSTAKTKDILEVVEKVKGV